MLKDFEGIVLRTVKYGDTSVILDIFTYSAGVRPFIISGVRSKKNKGRSAVVRVMNIVSFTAYEKSNNALSRIKEIGYAYLYKELPFDVFKGTVGLFLMEILRQSLRGSEANEVLYAYVKKRMTDLDNLEGSIANFHLIFLLELAGQLGFAPTDNYDLSRPYFNLQEGLFTGHQGDLRYLLDQDTSGLLHLLMKGEDDIHMDRKVRLRMLENLLNFYRYHINDFGTVHSLDVLKSLFS